MNPLRRSGILLPLFSLPSGFGIGDLGSEAYRFADFLAAAGQGIWQVLPLHPTDPIHGHAPYSSASAFAGNPLLVSPERLLREGLLHESDLDDRSSFPAGRVDYPGATAFKERLLGLAWRRFKRRSSRMTEPEWELFCREHASWLDDYALFRALKARFGGAPWHLWPRPLRDRQTEALRAAGEELTEAVSREKFLQYLFFIQWRDLKRYCNDLGIQIVADMPIYINHDSADVWTHPDLFQLDRRKKPAFVAGVPPDYFSKTGQLWGNPLYRWERLKKTGYAWMLARIGQELKWADWVRIDHFRGFVNYWAVPAGSPTAVNGRWVEAPAVDFFGKLFGRFPRPPVLCENLGSNTPEIAQVIDCFEFPGMRVLLFAFDTDPSQNPHAPHNVGERNVLYTGTHDNNTILGWFEREATSRAKRNLARYLGRRISPKRLHWDMIRLAMASPAGIAVFPAQDLLGLGQEARINRPGTVEGNWIWRLLPGQLTPTLGRRLREMARLYGREAP